MDTQPTKRFSVRRVVILLAGLFAAGMVIAIADLIIMVLITS